MCQVCNKAESVVLALLDDADCIARTYTLPMDEAAKDRMYATEDANPNYYKLGLCDSCLTNIRREMKDEAEWEASQRGEDYDDDEESDC